MIEWSDLMGVDFWLFLAASFGLLAVFVLALILMTDEQTTVRMVSRKELERMNEANSE